MPAAGQAPNAPAAEANQALDSNLKMQNSTNNLKQLNRLQQRYNQPADIRKGGSRWGLPLGLARRGRPGNRTRVAWESVLGVQGSARGSLPVAGGLEACSGPSVFDFASLPGSATGLEVLGISISQCMILSKSSARYTHMGSRPKT